MAPSSLPSGDPELRVDLVASFLQHPTARSSDWDVQRRFLLAKGFSEDEVQAAHQRCLTGAQSWPLKPLDVEGIPIALPATVGQEEPQEMAEEEGSGEDTDSDSSDSSTSSSSSDAESGSADDDVPIASLAENEGKKQDAQAALPFQVPFVDDKPPLAVLLEKEQKEQTVVPPQDRDDDVPLVSLSQKKRKEPAAVRPQVPFMDDKPPLAALLEKRQKEQIPVPQDRDDDVPLVSLSQNKRKEPAAVRPQVPCVDDKPPLAALLEKEQKEQTAVPPQDRDDDVPLFGLSQKKRKEQNAMRGQAQPSVAPKAMPEEVTSSSSSSSSSSSEDETAAAKPLPSVAAVAAAKPGDGGSTGTAAASTGPSPEAGFRFRSDSELWPPGSQEVRPMLPAQRKELRRVTQEVRACYQECQQDLVDLKAKAVAYRRACAGKSELTEAVAALEVEMEKLRRQWSRVVKELTSKWKDGLDPPAGAGLVGVRPQVVRGKRWYVACLDGVNGSKRLLGPLRPSFKEAADDQKLLLSKRPQEGKEEVLPEQVEEPGGSEKAEEPEVEVAPPRCKRLRLRAKVVDDD